MGQWRKEDDGADAIMMGWWPALASLACCMPIVIESVSFISWFERTNIVAVVLLEPEAFIYVFHFSPFTFVSSSSSAWWRVWWRVGGGLVYQCLTLIDDGHFEYLVLKYCICCLCIVAPFVVVPFALLFQWWCATRGFMATRFAFVAT